jgi:hypothetical protein
VTVDCLQGYDRRVPSADLDPLGAGALRAIADELIVDAERESVLLRLSGSLAVRHHCGERGAELLDLLDREPPGDVDLFAYWKARGPVEGMLTRRGWTSDPALAQGPEFGLKRFVYYTQDGAKVEIFFDTLKMSHEIDLRGRLELDSPTIALADLVLSKLQIHELTEKDIKDLVALLAVHELSEAPRPGADEIDVGRIAGALSADWGLWFTATQNMRAVDDALARYTRLPADMTATVRGRLERIAAAVDAKSKSLRWKMRAKVGDRTRWYEEVEQLDRGAE